MPCICCKAAAALSSEVLAAVAEAAAFVSLVLAFVSDVLAAISLFLAFVSEVFAAFADVAEALALPAEAVAEEAA